MRRRGRRSTTLCTSLTPPPDAHPKKERKPLESLAKSSSLALHLRRKFKFSVSAIRRWHLLAQKEGRRKEILKSKQLSTVYYLVLVLLVWTLCFLAAGKLAPRAYSNLCLRRRPRRPRPSSPPPWSKFKVFVRLPRPAGRRTASSSAAASNKRGGAGPPAASIPLHCSPPRLVLCSGGGRDHSTAQLASCTVCSTRTRSL